MKISHEGLSAVSGFVGGGFHCGIKKVVKPDLAMIYSERECSAAGVFTKNRIAASSVSITRQNLRSGRARAVIINSGNANVCTGPRGEEDSQSMIKAFSESLQIPQKEVCIASTGVIGQPLPIGNIVNTIPRLAGLLTVPGCHKAAEAIMTTDTFPKKITVRGLVGPTPVTVGGFAKGSGMIHPNMATMLAFLGTDLQIAAPLLKKALKFSVDLSFNNITIDTTSTNDMVLIFANGAAENPPFSETSKSFSQFQELLAAACLELAKMIVKDGEGATKFISIEVEGAQNSSHAKKIAYSIAQSPLVKTAFFGEDANWGRIMAAIGCAGVPVVENKIDMALEGVPFVKNGIGLGKNAEGEVSRILKQKEFCLEVNLNIGSGTARVWTTDLTHNYIKINASYRS